jgi:formamidopyrimidine-DNA glycosylase
VDRRHRLPGKRRNAGADYPVPVPEMLEVESYRQLVDRLVGLRVVKVDARDSHILKAGLTPSALATALGGLEVTGTRRIGKLMLVDTDGGPTVGMHFGMTGIVRLSGPTGVAYSDIDQLLYAPKRHDPLWDRLTVTFGDSSVLVLCDPRRLARITLDPDESALGPDAGTVKRAQLAAILAVGATPLKARLLDQSRLAGIGNLLADEMLFRSSLSPVRMTDTLDQTDVSRLHRHLLATLRILGKRGGSHTGDLMPERRPGGRCPKDGHELVRDAVGGRTSWWCPHHQR